MGEQLMGKTQIITNFIAILLAIVFGWFPAVVFTETTIESLAIDRAVYWWVFSFGYLATVLLARPLVSLIWYMAGASEASSKQQRYERTDPTFPGV